VELTYTLESVGRSDLSGTLKQGFSAHPKIDHVTGELHAVAYQPGLEARPATRAPSPTSLRRTAR
jgi:carotenoid cleavage dioxygenase-like enzyme